MSDLNRRQFLKNTLLNLVQAAGSVTLASAAIARAQSEPTQTGDVPGRAAGDLQQQADELAASFGPESEAALGEPAPVEPVQFRRPSDRLRDRRRPGRWRNGNWPNGRWRNGPFLNGGWPNGMWRNLPWRNGGWFNGGWGNW